MKFGICVNLLKKTPEDPAFGPIEKIAQYGFDYIELPLNQLIMLSISDFRALEARVKKAGIPCLACNDFFPRDFKLTGPGVNHQIVREYYHGAMKRASAIGASTIVFGSPWSKAVPPGFSKEEAYLQLLQLCREMAVAASKHNITIAIEHNNKTETNILNQLHEVGKLAEEVNHPNIKVLVDYYHIIAENEPVSNILRYGKHIVHTHFARYEGRRYPQKLSEDEMYKPYINALKAINYQGGVSIEAYSDDFDRDAPAALAFLREHFQ